MKKIFAALSLYALATGCSHEAGSIGSAPARATSSVESHAEYTLDALFAADDPRAETKALVGHLLNIRLRASSWIGEVDRAFQEAGDKEVEIFQLPAYRKLLAARPLVEKLEHKLADLYVEAREMSQSKVRDPEGRSDKAFLVVAGFRDALMEARHSKAQRVLLHDFIVTLKNSVAASPGKSGAKAVVEPLGKAQLAAAAAEAAPEIARLVSALPEHDEAVAAVEHEQAVMTIDEEDDNSRSPQSGAIFPSAGPNGNIDGFGFPVGTWALTFDDGPHPTHTMQDLGVLQKYGVKATFFWLASNIQRYTAIVKSVQGAGMPVENHSWNHPKLNDPKDLKRLHTDLNHEINDSTVLDTQVYGVRPRFFRNPYAAGFKNPVIRSMIAKQNMIHVRWNVDSEDWHDKNPASVLARVLSQMANVKRGVILFHDIQPHTPGVVDRLLALKKGAGRWVTIPQIVDELNGAK